MFVAPIDPAMAVLRHAPRDATLSGRGPPQMRQSKQPLGVYGRSLLVLALLPAIVAPIAACGRRKATAAPPPPPKVTVTPVVRKDLPIYLESVASLDGYTNVDIRARVRGVLRAQSYKEGGTVVAGQLLFSIDPAEFQAALAAAKATLARTQTSAHNSKLRLDRRQSLSAARVVSQQELEDAQAAAADAADQVRAAKAQVEQAALNLSYTQIRSPLTGIAGLALVRVGNLVGQAEPTLLTTVSNVEPIRVNFPMSEIDYVKSAHRLERLDVRDRAWAEAQFAAMARGLQVDDSLELLLADGTPYARRGVIVALNRQVDPTTGTIQVQALFPNPERVLRPGQFGRVRMRRSDVGNDALVVPERALIQVQGTYSVAVVGPDHKVKVRRVEVGPAAGGLRIMKSGVQAGELVVVEGVQKATDGAAVTAELTR
jgi:membrane fusion protein (multidrug efflux system)